MILMSLTGIIVSVTAGVLAWHTGLWMERLATGRWYVSYVWANALLCVVGISVLCWWMMMVM